MFRRPWFLVAFVALTAGCAGGASPPPPPVRAPQHLYVGNNNAAGTVVQYTLPITGASTPNFSIATEPMPVAVAVDSSGNLAVGNINSTTASQVQTFNAPLFGASTPAAAFSTGGGLVTGQIAFNTAGDMFVATTKNSVNVFTHPFSNASAPSSTVTNAALTTAVGAVVDAAGNLYVANAAAASSIVVFAPPYTGAPVVAPAVPASTYRKEAISATQLFVCSDSGGPGRVDVYSLPITAASAPAFAITNGVSTAEALAFDAAGNLYVGNLSNATVTVYAPPFSAASAPTATLILGPVIGFGLFGMAIGT